jgi:glucose-6-phosphate 1-dehydrogenase
LFASTWNNRCIESIDIICTEQIDAEGRCDFYERFGAIKDMVQSHLLQMLALATMQQPDNFSFAELAAKKLEILKHIVPEAGVLGQYRGYCVDERSADSRTDTFAALRFRIDTQNWQGVPCYITTGKALYEKRIEIRVTYKPITEHVFGHESSYEPNILTIEVAPKTGFMLQVNSKQPEAMHHVMPVTMEFCHSCLYAPYTRAAYEALFRAVMEGDRSLSVSLEEIEEQWRIIEQVYELDMPFEYYDSGTPGPSTAQIKKG